MSRLYLDHFGLKRPPFQITPDIDFFFSGSRRGDLLDALLHVASHEEGIATAVAEVGTGKTLLARLMISRLPENIRTVYLANPSFGRDEIISAIARDLGLDGLPASMEEKLSALYRELLALHAGGKRVLLVIDEAHTMPLESLEEVRLLSNLETSHHKLINIMLFGQPELDALLADRRLRQLRDRVNHRFDLLPLSRQDGIAYIDHRLRTAGWRGGRLLTERATSVLLKASGGRARRVNLLADKALLAAYAEGKMEVDEGHARSAIHELQPDPAAPHGFRPSRWQAAALGAVMASAALGAIAYWPKAARNNTPAATAVPARPIAAPVPPLNPSTPTPPSLPQAGASVAPMPQPASGDSARDTIDSAMARTEQRLKGAPAGGYTLQLTSLTAGTDADQYLKVMARNIDVSKLYAHNRAYGGKQYVAIYFGHYETRREAMSALTQLPKTVTADRPIIRTWAGIRQETTQ